MQPGEEKTPESDKRKKKKLDKMIKDLIPKPPFGKSERRFKKKILYTFVSHVSKHFLEIRTPSGN